MSDNAIKGDVRTLAAEVRLALLDAFPHPDVPGGLVRDAKAAFGRFASAVLSDEVPVVVTEKVIPCKHCGNLPGIRGGQEPNKLYWSFYLKCFHCGDTERGSHRTVAGAVAAWARAMR